MPSTVEKLSPTRVKLTVEIPFADLKPHLDKAYKEIAEQVSIPGFRKGKVPAVVIDQRFGRGVVLQEAINDAMQPAYEAALAEAKVAPLGQPEIEITKLEDGEVVEFTAEVDIRPDFDLPDFAAIETTVDALPSLDDEVEERIALLRKRFATTTELDREAQEGDVLTIDLTAAQDGEELPEASATGVTLTVGEDSGMLEGLDEAVRGLKAGESKTFASTLIGGPFRGQEADITVTVTQVAEEELPALDDEFAQLISEFDTVEEMREDLSKAVLAQAKAEQVAEARDKILEAALAQVDFEVPVDVLARELEARRNQISDQLARAGLTVLPGAGRGRGRGGRRRVLGTGGRAFHPGAARPVAPRQVRRRQRGSRLPAGVHRADPPQGHRAAHHAAGSGQPHDGTQPHVRVAAGDPSRQGARRHL